MAQKESEAYRKASKRVEAKIGFYIHLTVYVLINILLIVINLSTSSQHFWFKWPLLGWGAGLIFHAIGIFVLNDTSSFKEKMIEHEMKNNQHKNKKK